MRSLGCVVVVALAVASCSKSSEPARKGVEPAASPNGDDAGEDAAAAAAWQPDRSCTRDDECRPAPSCCPMPCNGDVINVRDLARAQAELRKTCPRTPADCPVAGSCPGHAYLCVDGACALVMEGDPSYRAPAP